MSASASLSHGAISISATETALNIYLSEQLRGFHAQYPGIRLRITNHSTLQAVQAVKNGEVDFAVVTTPAETGSDLKRVALMPFNEILVGGPSFAELAGRTLALQELTVYPLIMLESGSMSRIFYRQFFLEHNAELKPDIEAGTTDQMLTLVRSDLGLAFVPEPMARGNLHRKRILQMNLQELGTVMEQKAPVKMILLNNNFLGNVRQWQAMFFNRRYSFTPMMNPDYLKIASAYGIPARRALTRKELAEAIEEMISTDGPFLLEACVEEEGNVMPMTPPGGSVNQMLLEC